MTALAILTLALAAATGGDGSPRRIVSTSPSITETLFALGLGDRVVGVSQYCRHPEAAATRPKIGPFLKPDAEAIVRLAPDLVVLHSASTPLEGRLTALGLRHTAVERGGLAAVYSTIRRLGDAAGVPDRARELVADIEGRLARLREEGAKRRKPKVLLILGRRPGTLSDIVAVGRGSYIDELLEIAGGLNVLATPGVPEYPRISMETIVRLQPDVIIDTADMGETAEERTRNGRAAAELWRRNTMVSARVCPMTTDALVVPGPRVVEAAEWLRDRLLEPRTP